MKILVTGGAGFIGANLCKLLSSRREVTDIVALDDLSTGLASNLTGARVRLIVGSVLDDDALNEAVTGADAIVHLAALPSVPRSIQDPRATHEANATGTLRVLDAARGLSDPVVIVASSSSVYGANPELPKHEDLTPMPMSPYAVSKLAAEQYAIAWQHSYGMRTMVFRFFNVFGPLQGAGHPYAAVVPKFISASLAGEPLQVHGDGLQTRDFTYVGSVCQAVENALQRRLSWQTPVNLAFGSRRTLLDVVDIISDVIQKPVEMTHSPGRVGDVRHSQADSSLLRSLLPGVEPIGLREGLEETVQWFQARSRSHS